MNRAIATQTLIEIGHRLAVEVLGDNLPLALSDAEEYREIYLSLKVDFRRTRAPLPSVDDPRLSPRQRQAVELAAKGLSGATIARDLGISPGTVKIHLKHARMKTGVAQ